jgi:multidrug resistance efflux pump
MDFDHDHHREHEDEIRDIWRAIHDLQENQMSTQADVDAVTTAVDQVATDLVTTQSALQAEIDLLASANPSLDLSALQAAVAPLDASVQALGALQPTSQTPPDPAPMPDPAPIPAPDPAPGS